MKEIAFLAEVYWFLGEKLVWIIEELFDDVGWEISEICFFGEQKGILGELNINLIMY